MVTRALDGDRTFAGFGGGKASDSFADCQHRYFYLAEPPACLPAAWPKNSLERTERRACIQNPPQACIFLVLSGQQRCDSFKSDLFRPTE